MIDKNAQKLQDLLDKSDFCMMTTINSEGNLVSRPMSTQEREFDGDLWFFSYDNSEKAAEIENNPSVNIAYQGDGYYVSIMGTAEIIHNERKAEELWNPVLTAWYPDGLDTPHLCLIKVNASSAQYWDSPESKAAQLYGMAKAVVTNEEASYGENEIVDLD